MTLNEYHIFPLQGPESEFTGEISEQDFLAQIKAEFPEINWSEVEARFDKKYIYDTYMYESIYDAHTAWDIYIVNKYGR